MSILVFNDLFSDGMVLQRLEPISIFGVAKENCEISIEFAGQKTEEKLLSGNFKIVLPAEDTTFDLTMHVYVNGKLEKSIFNICVGEVWIAGGQSNMGFSLKETTDRGKDIENSHIRLFSVARNNSAAPEEYGKGYEWAFNKDTGWMKCNPRNADDFSAIAYHFAINLYNKLKIPVGIISCNVGGSNIMSWLSQDTIIKSKELNVVQDKYWENSNNDIINHIEIFQSYLDEHILPLKSQNSTQELPTVYYETPGPYCYKSPSCLYDSMLNKVINYTAKGMIWYQGESEAMSDDISYYKNAMLSLIDLLKSHNLNEGYKFLYAQIAPWGEGENTLWANMMDLQREFALEYTEYPMITLGDVGDYDIHPKHKSVAGYRFALAALRTVYGYDYEFCGPLAYEARLENNKIVIKFKHSKMLSSAESVVIQLHDNKNNCQKAQGTINDNKLTIHLGNNQDIERVRYAWHWYPKISLFNQQDLPASPFELKIEK